jgi:phosphoenolpyruvate synthase/pyruvate phosphate dikinase
VINGVAASPGRRRGRARVVVSSDDLVRVAAGEILVTGSASPELVLVFDRVAAFVTDQGGRSAHACVVAREFGIPGVVGTQVATQAIPDGSVVSVDGSTGTVAVLGID